MAPLASDNLDSSPFHDNSETDLQPFFVLHKACSSSLSSSTRPKSRRKLNEEHVKDSDDTYLNNLRLGAFHYVWSKIETTIKDVLKETNISIFNGVNAWVHDSFKAIRSCGKPGFGEATQSYPITLDAMSKQIFTGLVYTKNMEFVDDQLTFEELGNHLKSCGCHVANMTSLDFSAKNGIVGCLTRLIRKFLMVTLDDADMLILASWYSGQRECMPVVIIIEDTERCCSSVLSDFVLMLSKWVIKIPIILVMGIATTIDAPGNILPSNSLLCLRTSKFFLGSPIQRMDAIVEAVLLRPCSLFNVGHKIALFMKDYFLKHDGTLTSFVRALKIACMLHFSSEPLSFLLKYLDGEDQFQELWAEKHNFLQDMVSKYSSQLSCKSDNVGEPRIENLVHAVRELKKLHKRWATIVMCLNKAGKASKVQLLDLYCEALNPDIYKTTMSYDKGKSSLKNGCFFSEHDGTLKKASICKVVRKIRELSPVELSELLNSWVRHADDSFEIRDKVTELQTLVNSMDDKSSRSVVNISLRSGSSGADAFVESKALDEKIAALIEWMLRDQLKPIESLPFHEILCFKKVDKLQAALLGDPRTRIQADLLEFQKFLRCSCCSTRGTTLLPSLHDTSIMYILAQEYGDIINVHDWFQSFKSILANPSSKSKSKSKRSTPKKKDSEQSNNDTEAEIQSRFCKAISELQVTGLLRMPTKRRPDFVQRVAFGL